MNTMKTILKIFGYFFILIITSYFIFILFLYSSTGQKIITQYTSDMLNNELNGRVEISGIHSNLFSHIDIDNFYLKKNADTLIYFENAVIDYSLLSLLNGKLIFKSIKVDGLKINIRRDSSGVFQLSLLNTENSKMDTTSSSQYVAIENLSINDSKFRYDDRSIPINIIGHNLSANMSLVNNIFKLDVTLHSLCFDYYNEPLISDSIKIKAEINSSSIIIDTVVLHMPKLNLSGKLDIGIANNPITLNGSFHGNGSPYNTIKSILDTAALTYLNKNDQTIFDVTLNGDISNLTISSSISAINISTIPISASLITINIQKDRILFPQINLEILGGRVNIKGYIDLNRNKSYELSLNMNNIKVKKIIPSNYNTIPLLNGSLNGYFESSGKLINLKQINIK